MLYALLLLIALLLVAYFGGRWLAAELREASGAIGTRVKLWRGGLTSDHLLARTRAAFAEHGLEADCIVLSSRITRVYDALRREVIGQRLEPPLAGAVVLALAVDVDAARLYVRAVDTGGGIGRDRAAWHGLDEIAAVRQCPNRLPEAVSPPGEEVLEIATAGGRYHLVLEPGWGVLPGELAERLRAMLIDRRKPAGAPVVVR